ncbi:MAG: DNA polymerase IV [Acidobacteriota bacterium]|nr:DNA polymerase IV [Acidobacteriota bacterium]
MSGVRKIIHIDMDAFFASVEQRDFPHLRGKPVVVGGRPGKRGVVAAASYEARRFGIHSAMPSLQAQKRCPHAVFVPARFDVYRSVSGQIREIFLDYTELVEPLSLDEAYLDVTENKKGNPSATLIANEIRSRIFQKTRLTASAGVAPNKFLAKVASDINKPNGIFVIPPKRVLSFIEQLPIGKFHGIGKATEKRMHELGIYTGADLRQRTERELIRHFGKTGAYYYKISRGQDDREVVPHRERKSVGVEETFVDDLETEEEMAHILKTLAKELERRLKKGKLSGKTVTLKLRYPDFDTITRAHTLDNYVFKADVLFRVAISHLKETEALKRRVRLLGITVSNLERTDIKREVQLWLPFGQGESF